MIKPSGGMMCQGMRKEIQTKGVIGDSIHFNALGGMQEFIEMLVGIITRQTMKLARILDLLNHIILQSKFRTGKSPFPSPAISELFKRVRSERGLFQIVSSGLSRVNSESYMICCCGGGGSGRVIVVASVVAKVKDSKRGEVVGFGDLGKSHVALAGPNPKPMHDDFVATVYPKVHESLKFPADEHIILEDPPSSSETLSSMKNLDDTYTFRDQFFNDKSAKDEPGKHNVDAEVISMLTIPIREASTLVPHLSAPIIDLSPPKLAASPLLKSFTVTTIETTTTTLTLPPPPQQQSTTDLELAARITALEKKFTDVE
nr:hypothetical protein [Tanacetum cinerariifolium]